jgi:hypothetical protein
MTSSLSGISPDERTAKLIQAQAEFQLGENKARPWLAPAGLSSMTPTHSHSIISGCPKRLISRSIPAHVDLNTACDTVRIVAWRIDDAKSHHQPATAGKAPEVAE